MPNPRTEAACDPQAVRQPLKEKMGWTGPHVGDRHPFQTTGRGDGIRQPAARPPDPQPEAGVCAGLCPCLKIQ